MFVSKILETKSVQSIETIAATDTLESAVKILAEKRIGALLVGGSGGAPAGILSERDIVRVLAAEGAGVMERPVGDFMTKKVVTCSPHDRADQVLESMTSGRFRHLPVVDEGKLVGVISIGDVVKARLGEVAMEKTAMEELIMGH